MEKTLPIQKTSNMQISFAGAKDAPVVLPTYIPAPPQQADVKSPMYAYPSNYYLNTNPQNGYVSNSIKAESQPAPSPTMAYPQNYYVTPPTQPQNGGNKPIPPIGQQTSGVNIMIFNPTVQPADGTINSSCNYVLPPGYPPPPQPVNNTNVNNNNNNQPPAATKFFDAPAKKEEEKKYKKEVTELDDQLIMTVENYLRNPNKEIRLQGITKLIDLLKEDPENRRDDVALNNLVNLALQDKDPSIRVLAMSAIQEGIAKGDELTTQLLNNLAQTPNTLGEQEIAASAALNRIGNKTTIETTKPPKEEKKKG